MSFKKSNVEDPWLEFNPGTLSQVLPSSKVLARKPVFPESIPRIKRVVFAAKDKKTGAAASFCNIFALNHNHKVEVKGGVLEEQCANIISSFFKAKRSCAAQA